MLSIPEIMVYPGLLAGGGCMLSVAGGLGPCCCCELSCGWLINDVQIVGNCTRIILGSTLYGSVMDCGSSSVYHIDCCASFGTCVRGSCGVRQSKRLRGRCISLPGNAMSRDYAVEGRIHPRLNVL